MANTKISETQKLTETAIMIALATLLSYVTIFTAPMGGSITAFSQVPIVIIGYRYGFKWGAGTGVIHGILQMLLQGLGNFAYVKGVGAYIILILADYVVAFACLGIGGALSSERLLKTRRLRLRWAALSHRFSDLYATLSPALRSGANMRMDGSPFGLTASATTVIICCLRVLSPWSA